MEQKTAGNHVQGLDVLRVLAIVSVFVFHYSRSAGPLWFQSIGRFGWMGVDLFFVLSGYLIGGQLFKKLQETGKISLRDFYIQRAFRILPSYWAVVALYFLVPGFTDDRGTSPLWKFLTFTQNFGLDLFQDSFSHAWSLCVEEHFYLIFPWLAFAFWKWGTPKKVIAFLISLIAGGMILRSTLWFHLVKPILGAENSHDLAKTFYQQIYYPTYNRLDGLAIGAVLAAISVYRPHVWKAFQKNWIGCFILGIFLLAMSWRMDGDRYALQASALVYPLVALAFGCLLIFAASPVSPLNQWRIPGARWAATLAFSFYLTHKHFIHVAMTFGTSKGLHHDGFILMIFSFVCSLFAAICLHLLIERPFLKLRSSVMPQLSKQNENCGTVV